MAGSQPLFSLQLTQMCDAVVCWNVSEALSLLICEHFGGRHIAPHGAWQKAGTPLVSGLESPAPPLCHVPGLGGLLIMLNEDCVGPYPCSRMSSWHKSRKTFGWKNGALPGCLPPWLPAKWDFWSQAQAQM